MNKRGFTLVELLAVIVILAIILVISIPKILNVIDDSRLSTMKDTTQMIASSAEKEYVTRTALGTLNQTTNPILCSDVTKISSDEYESCSVLFGDNKAYATFYGSGKFDGYVCMGSKGEATCVTTDNYDALKGVNKPLLVEGMTPIKWNGSAWVTTTASDSSWYDYTNKIWANARTADGSIWVWIPRYIYKINNNWHQKTTGTISVQFSKGIDDNWNSAVIGNINVDSSSTASNNAWTNHMGFTFGNTELTGIWVAKFEATAAEGVANTAAGDNVTTKTVKIVPNVSSWRYIEIGKAFTNVRNMETKSTYGWGTSGNGIDTHLMKNTEWGTIAYLSKSVYGKEATEIWINNSSTFITGCAANSVSESLYTGCENTYETTNGVKASTTGNVYGVYDASGGAVEFVSAYLDSGSSNLTTYGSSIMNATSKYKDIYNSAESQTLNYNGSINKKSDAIYETSNSYTYDNAWFGDESSMPVGNALYLARGGVNYYSTAAGIFSFDTGYGENRDLYGFRPVLIIGSDF